MAWWRPRSRLPYSNRNKFANRAPTKRAVDAKVLHGRCSTTKRWGQMPTSEVAADVTPPALDAELFAWFEEALVHHRAGRLAEALRRYDRILLQKPDLAQVHSNRGRSRLPAARDTW